MCFVDIQVVHLYSSTDVVPARKNYCFILSERSDFNMIDDLSIAIYTFPRVFHCSDT